jgi:dTDP-4-dehydrorhamnose reductase
MIVLVTGGTGLVGSAIKSIQPDWIYLSSKDCDLNDFSQVKELFIKKKLDRRKFLFVFQKIGGINYIIIKVQ